MISALSTIPYSWEGSWQLLHEKQRVWATHGVYQLLKLSLEGWTKSSSSDSKWGLNFKVPQDCSKQRTQASPPEPPHSTWALTSCPASLPSLCLDARTRDTRFYITSPLPSTWALTPRPRCPGGTDLLTCTGGPSGGHTPHRVPEPALSSTQSNRLRNSGRKTTKPASALLKGLGKKRKNSWERPSCLKAIVTPPSFLLRLLKILISRELKCNEQQWSLSTSAVR